MIRYEDFLASLPEDERREIADGARELIMEEATLRELRKARAQSQQEIAARLGIGQASVSKIERRTDMYVSTLRQWIAAMGGELEIIARFPGRGPVRVTQFRDMRGEAAN
jgi:DNA-binding XRE family transcriptional regulator